MDHSLKQDCARITISLKGEFRGRNENEETSPLSLKPGSFLRHLSVKVSKQNCVVNTTSVKINSQSGSSLLKMQHLCLPPPISTPARQPSRSPTLNNLLGGCCGVRHSKRGIDMVGQNLTEQREMVEALRTDYSVRQICEMLGFTRSNLYYHPKQAPFEAVLREEIETLDLRYPTF